MTQFSPLHTTTGQDTLARCAQEVPEQNTQCPFKEDQYRYSAMISTSMFTIGRGDAPSRKELISTLSKRPKHHCNIDIGFLFINIKIFISNINILILNIGLNTFLISISLELAKHQVQYFLKVKKSLSLWHLFTTGSSKDEYERQICGINSPSFYPFFLHFPFTLSPFFLHSQPFLHITPWTIIMTFYSSQQSYHFHSTANCAEISQLRGEGGMLGWRGTSQHNVPHLRAKEQNIRSVSMQ